MKHSDYPPLILSIDTSCDETSGAITLGRVILANVVASQIQIHKKYGGVFPTLAKRAHQKNIEPVVNSCLKKARIKPNQLDAIAVTQGPGLAPALEVGIKYAINLAEKWDKPLIAINHIEAHALSTLVKRNSRQYKTKKMLTIKKNKKRQKELKSNDFPNWRTNFTNQELPALALVVSGGHSEFILIKKIGDYSILGQTIDDAAGEALDKVGRMLNLGYPAGPVVEKVAKNGNEKQFKFPLPMTTKKNFNLSYSGLKTSAHRLIKRLEEENKINQHTIFDLAASFQYAVFRHIGYKLDKLLQHFDDQNEMIDQLWLGGGVASNIALRKHLRQILKKYHIKLNVPFAKHLCGDNAAMIGIAASFHYQKNNFVQ
ncbi:MAG: tRNA (adenosine(37)-N6)-threonylcarbamoyltransferase complex transferase subunit TsaD, partial [Patescibacteria group bacterium]|nr:tRNA (adenosine(37)-N6)-threonylcarbamoyltransferase complex transferase subunit TsaD [Patescibacteria group bacterium]